MLWTLADGESLVITPGSGWLTVISGAGATVTVSRVDSRRATAHTTGTENSFTVAATTRTTTEVDWPYYRVSVAGGPCRIASGPD